MHYFVLLYSFKTDAARLLDVINVPNPMALLEKQNRPIILPQIVKPLSTKYMFCNTTVNEMKAYMFKSRQRDILLYLCLVIPSGDYFENYRQ